MIESSPRLRVSVSRWGKRPCNGLVAVLLAGCVASLSGQQLLDRVVARVDGVAITLLDLRAALALGIGEVPAGAGEQTAIDRLVDRQLVLAEVARFVPPEPAPAAVDRVFAALAERTGDRLAAVMDSTGLDEGRIREIARDNLRIEAYLNQRFGVSVQLTEDEVLQYYRIHPEAFTRDARLMPFGEAAPAARRLAGAERRASAVAQWMRDLRNRAEIAISRQSAVTACSAQLPTAPCLLPTADNRNAQHFQRVEAGVTHERRHRAAAA